MPSYELLALLGGIVFAGLLVYQRLWTRLYRRRSRFEGLSTLEGRVRGPVGTSTLLVEPASRARVGRAEAQPQGAEPDGTAAVEVSIAAAELVAWPGPGAWRRSRDLRKGDPVTILGVEAAGEPLEAICVVRGAWPELPWSGLPVALVAALLGLLLSQLIREPVLVASVVPAPSASVHYAHGGADLRAILELTSRTESVHDWAAAGERDTAPGSSETALEPEAESDRAGSDSAENGRAARGRREGTRAESLFAYLESRPRLATRERRYLYLQPIGELAGREREVLALTADFLARHVCLPVKLATELPLSRVAWHARRVHPSWGIPQLLSTWLVHSLLRSRRPDDAAAYLGVTSVDLWPGAGWHSVNGHASPVARVGVLSTYRNGPLDGRESFRLHLLRTLKVAAHETAHIFSIPHCPRRGCNLSDKNDRAEADRRVLALCPDCLAKLLAATSCDPVARYRSLLAFFERHGLAAEAGLHRRLLAATTRSAE